MKKPLRAGVTAAVLLVTPAVAGAAADSVAQAGPNRTTAAACTATVSLPDADRTQAGKGPEQISDVVDVSCTGLSPDTEFLVDDVQSDLVQQSQARSEFWQSLADGKQYGVGYGKSKGQGTLHTRVGQVYRADGEKQGTRNKVEGRGTLRPVTCAGFRSEADVEYTYTSDEFISD